MTINLTRPTPVIPVAPVPAPTDPRDAMMRAFAVAETVVAQLTGRPASVTLVEAGASYTVEVYFHHEPEQVEQFASVFGVEVDARPHLTSPQKTYTSAELVVDRVPVRAWSLATAGAVAA